MIRGAPSRARECALDHRHIPIRSFCRPCRGFLRLSSRYPRLRRGLGSDTATAVKKSSAAVRSEVRERGAFSRRSARAVQGGTRVRDESKSFTPFDCQCQPSATMRTTAKSFRGGLVSPAKCRLAGEGCNQYEVVTSEQNCNIVSDPAVHSSPSACRRRDRLSGQIIHPRPYG